MADIGKSYNVSHATMSRAGGQRRSGGSGV